MIDILVLFLRGGSASTATLPLEIFQNAGTLWNALNGQPLAPRFRVRTASIDGRAVRIDSLVTMTPLMSFSQVRTPQLVFVPAGGCELDAVLRDGYDLDVVIAKNSAVIPWLKRWAARGAQIAGHVPASRCSPRPACWTGGRPRRIGGWPSSIASVFPPSIGAPSIS